MDKKTFLEELSKALVKLPNNERKVLIDFYGELIDDKIECGISEKEVIASFGSVNVLAERLLIENPNRKKSGCIFWVLGAVVFMVILFFLMFLNFSDSETTVTINENQFQTNTGSSTNDDFITVSYDYNDIDEVSLDADASKIVVEKSADNNINIKYKEYKDEINRIELKGRKLEFDNELKTNRPNKMVEHTIYVQLPVKYNGYIDISADLGSIKAEGLDVSKIDLSADLGKIEIENCTALDIELSSSMGSISAKNTVAQRSFDASSDMGVVDFSDIDGQIIELSTDMGSVKGNILGKQEEYSISSEIGMGKSNVSNQTGGSKNLNVSTDMGNINISFGK